jgi:hypothetical protein
MACRVFGLTRLFRIPSFRIAYTIGLIVPLTLLIWAFVDAHFWNAIHTFLGIVGIESSFTDTFATAWKTFGGRLL